MFIIGNQVVGGLYGTYPALGDLDSNGNLKATADFRSVYAGMLKDVLGADPVPILEGLGLSPTARGEELTVGDFARLAAATRRAAAQARL